MLEPAPRKPRYGSLAKQLAHAGPPETWNELWDRFWSKVGFGHECWEWAGSLDRGGYGQFSIRGVPIKSHRVAWILHHRSDAMKMVLHRCDNRRCVRPDHLFLGTALDNARDASAKGRIARGELSRSAKLTAADVVVIRRAHREGASCYSLAKRFSLNQTSMARIISGQHWAHVVEPTDSKS